MAKNYVITSFYDGNNRFWDLNINGHYEYKGNAPPHVPYTLDYMLESLQLNGGRDCKIYSVKRLSDNKIFKIGDKVEYSVRGIWNKLSISNIVELNVMDVLHRILIKTNAGRNQQTISWAFVDDTIRHVDEQPVIVEEDPETPVYEC